MSDCVCIKCDQLRGECCDLEAEVERLGKDVAYRSEVVAGLQRENERLREQVQSWRDGHNVQEHRHLTVVAGLQEDLDEMTSERNERGREITRLQKQAEAHTKMINMSLESCERMRDIARRRWVAIRDCVEWLDETIADLYKLSGWDTGEVVAGMKQQVGTLKKAND